MASANSSNWPLDDCTPRVSLLKKLTLSPDTASKQRRMASHLQFALSLHHGRSTCHPQIWRVFTVGAHLVGTKLLNKFALLATSSIWLSASLERNGERGSPCLKPLPLCLEETLPRSIDQNWKTGWRDTSLKPFTPFNTKTHMPQHIKEELMFHPVMNIFKI